MSGKVLRRAVAVTKARDNALGGSRQLPADPFSKLYGEKGLVIPPYNLEKLLSFREMHAIHGACVEQKAVDVAGLGWTWVARPGVDKPDPKQRDELEQFLSECNPDMTFKEILQAVWDDKEAIGWGAIEVVRRGDGLPAELYHVPAHTLRAHKDGIRFAQYREGQFRWFKRLGAEQDFDMDTGEPVPTSYPEEKKAGELLVIRSVVSRSSYYGIPMWIAALRAILGSLEAGDYSLDWFRERTVPDYVLVVKGADVSDELEAELKGYFDKVGKGKHHKLLVLPLPEENVDAKFEKLTAEVRDASFRLYRMDNALEICVAHRVPPYRIGWPIMGSLGGATAREMTEIYKNSVVEPGQVVLEHRLNTKLFNLFGRGKPLDWVWELNEIDLTDQQADLEYAVKRLQHMLFTVNEARAWLGDQPYESDTLLVPNGYTAVPVTKSGRIAKAERDVEDALSRAFLKKHSEAEALLREEVVRFFEDSGNGRWPVWPRSLTEM